MHERSTAGCANFTTQRRIRSSILLLNKLIITIPPLLMRQPSWILTSGHMGDCPKGSFTINFIMLHKLPTFLDGVDHHFYMLMFRAKVYVHHVLCAKIFDVLFVLGSIGWRLSYFGLQWQVDHNGECNKSKHCRSTLHCVRWMFEVRAQCLVMDELKWIHIGHDQQFN